MIDQVFARLSETSHRDKLCPVLRDKAGLVSSLPETAKAIFLSLFAVRERLAFAAAPTGVRLSLGDVGFLLYEG